METQFGAVTVLALYIFFQVVARICPWIAREPRALDLSGGRTSRGEQHRIVGSGALNLMSQRVERASKSV